MAAIEPGVDVQGGEQAQRQLRREDVGEPPLQEDGRFQPGCRRAAGSGASKLLEAREQLSNLLRYMDGKAAASDQLKALLADPQLMAAFATGSSASVGAKRRG